MIRRLPDALVNKIAAGEVVERPASAVKELTENALDAGARTIAVDVRDGGGGLIRVTDDGLGIAADELPLALERHATSKLSRDEDLDAIETLGFRGEALAAICAVARFSVTSRTGEAAEGARLAGEGGSVTQRLAVPCERGTIVEVRDLFYNTPARLKFMKSVPAEAAAILRAVTALALAHPRVAFRVTHNGRYALTAPAARDLRERIGALWGWDIGARLLAVDRAEHGVRVSGYASPPDITRGGRDDVVTIINGRPVRDPALFQAVLAAYRAVLPRDRFPLLVLAIEVSPADVDANVHPTKAWVRFRHPRLVHEMVGAALHDALRSRGVVTALAPAPPAAAHSAPRDTTPAESAQPGMFSESAAPYTAGRFGRVLGQAQDTFIVTTDDTEVFFLDQHVVHERVLFERLRRDAESGVAASQSLLFAEAIALPPPARALLAAWHEPLERLGFAFEDNGGAVALRAVPAVLKADEPRRLVEAVVDELGGPKAGTPALERMLAFVACRGAIKANQPLVREEMERLVADLSHTDTPYFCPHGRPIISRVSLADIRRELKRTW